MSFGSIPRRRGKYVARWNHLKLGEGKQVKCWLAGPIVWIECHHLGVTRGCRHALTNGAVKCPHNHKELPTEWRGYVPLWDEDCQRVFVLLCEEEFQRVNGLKHLAELVVMKTAFHGRPIRLYEREWAKARPRVTVNDAQPQDIRPFLVVLWKDAALREYYAEHPMEPLEGTEAYLSESPGQAIVTALRERQAQGQRAKDGATVNRLDGPQAVGDVLAGSTLLNGRHKK